jgi:transposase-like protein
MVRPGRDKLNGIVEVNETLIGGERQGKRGRGAEGKTLVLIALENKEGKIGRIRLSAIGDASGSILTDAIMQMVSIGSVMHTDGWSGYNDLSNHGYAHQPSYNRSVKAADTIPMPHLVAALLKRWLLGTHQGTINHKNLPYYLDEFTFRFNRRTSRSRGKLFHRLIQQALDLEPIPAKVAVTACIHKLLIILNAIMRNAYKQNLVPQ